jgi:tetratricopeptide (TPR) repeat protein
MSFLFARLIRLSRPAVFFLIALSTALALHSTTFSQDDPAPAPESEALIFFNKGQDAHEKKEFALAVENYDKAIKLVPDFPEAELQRGNALISIGKLNDAEASFRRALELREGWSLAQANLGSLLVQKKQYVEAEKFLTSAIENEELNFPAYAAMTELRLKTKASPAVVEALLTKLRTLTSKANPTASIWASRSALENVVSDKKIAKASAARALELDNKNLTALTVSADVALFENDPAAAEPFVKRLEALVPDAESTKGLRARVLIAQGKYDDALALLSSVPGPGQEIVDLKNQLSATKTVDVAELEKHLATDLKNPVILAKLCSAYRVSDPNKSLEYCRQAAEAAPTDVQPVVGYGAALVQAKRYDEAVAVLRRLITTIAPDNATARANLATALFQLKRYPEAKAEFRWLTDHQPEQPIAYYFLAIVHDQLTEFPDAAANYQLFLKLADPELSKLEIEKVNLRLPVVQKLIKEGKGKKRG